MIETREIRNLTDGLTDYVGHLHVRKKQCLGKNIDNGKPSH